MVLFRSLIAGVAFMAAGATWAEAGSEPSGPPPADRAALKSEADALFRRIYAKPDDLDGLFRYAQVATELGDLEAAIGVLERILYYRSGLPRVKLELGVLYARLGSFPMARSYFSAVLTEPDLPEPVRRRVVAQLAALASAERGERPVTAFLQTGVRYQSNANAGPNGLLVRAVGNDAILDRAFVRQPDWNWFAQGGVRWIANLDDGRGDTWETGVFGYQSAQQRFSQLDLGFVELVSGPRIVLSQTAWLRPYALANASSLGSNPYMSSVGLGGTVSVQLAPWLILEPNVEMRWRNYTNSPDYRFATEQDGTYGTVTGLARGRLGSAWGWQALASWSRNATASRTDWYAFTQSLIGAGLSRDFSYRIAGIERICTVWLHGSFSRTAYDAPNPLVDPDVNRVDREWRAALTFEAPVTQVFGLAGSASYTRVNSTLPNFDTSNFSVALGPYARF